MVQALLALLKGMGLGLGAAVPIGPVNVEIARRTLKSGFRAGFALGCGACTIDMIYAVLVSVGLGTWLGQSRPLGIALGIAGAAVLAWLGWQCLHGAWHALRHRPEPEPDDSAPTRDNGPAPWQSGGGVAVAEQLLTRRAALRGYGQGLLMTSTNPMTLVFWFVGVAGYGQGLMGGRGMGWLAAGVGIGAVLWVVFFAGTLSLLGRWKKGAWVVATDILGGVILLTFAAAALWRVLLALRA